MFKRFKKNIGTFFRNLLCCYHKNREENNIEQNETIENNIEQNNIKQNETIKINISEITKPYLGRFVDGVWNGIRTRDFYRDHDFVLKDPNVKIIYIYDHKKMDDLYKHVNNTNVINNTDIKNINITD